MSKLRERLSDRSIAAARVIILFFGGVVIVPLINTQLVKTGLAIDASERHELASEAVYTPSLTPIPREPMREAEPLMNPPPVRPRERSQPFIPIDPFGGEAEYTLDHEPYPTRGSRGVPRFFPGY